MSMFHTLDIAASGMGLSRFWMDTIGHNLANSNTVRSGDEEPFRAQMVLARERQGGGVEIAGAIRQEGDPTRVFDPAHPASDDNGYVTLPVIDLAGQMTDLIVASRSYQMNLEVLRDAREAYQSALNLGRR